MSEEGINNWYGIRLSMNCFRQDEWSVFHPFPKVFYAGSGCFAKISVSCIIGRSLTTPKEKSYGHFSPQILRNNNLC